MAESESHSQKGSLTGIYKNGAPSSLLGTAYIYLSSLQLLMPTAWSTLPIPEANVKNVLGNLSCLEVICELTIAPILQYLYDWSWKRMDGPRLSKSSISQLFFLKDARSLVSRVRQSLKQSPVINQRWHAKDRVAADHLWGCDRVDE